MSDVYDLIKHAVEDNPAEIQKTFSELMLDKISDTIADKKAELSASLIGNADIEFDDELEFDDEDLEDVSDLEDTDLTLDSEEDSEDEVA